MGASNYVYVQVSKILYETEKAFMLSLVEEDRSLWIPKSQIADPDDYEVGDEDIELAITEWFANKEELPYE